MFFASNRLIHSPWPNTTKEGELLAALHTGLEITRGAAPPPVLYISQGVLTPDDDSIKSSLTPFSKSAQDLCKHVNPKVVSWWVKLGVHLKPRRNILILDHIDEATARAIIRVNVESAVICHAGTA